jgi:hypothetical protein
MRGTVAVLPTLQRFILRKDRYGCRRSTARYPSSPKVDAKFTLHQHKYFTYRVRTVQYAVCRMLQWRPVVTHAIAIAIANIAICNFYNLFLKLQGDFVLRANFV